MPDDLDYQRRMLPRVSRTFALTVPQLPQPLDRIVANAYLLCRIADSIEDDPGLEPETRRALHALLPRVIDDPQAAEHFAGRAAAALSPATSPEERDLAVNTPRVAQTARELPADDRRAIGACLREMCLGMDHYRQRERLGLDDLADMERYCHYVAGVVGEMLTELFCNHGAGMTRRRDEMRLYADSFGLGLQMTNILKDVWDDLAEQRCWLPRAEFEKAGYDLDRLAPHRDRETINHVIDTLVAVAHGHLRNALTYTLCIPPRETGIRRFCLWSIGLALLTLKRIHANPVYDKGSDVKVSRKAVGSVIASTRVAGRLNGGARLLFGLWSRGLPLREAPLEGQPRLTNGHG